MTKALKKSIMHRSKLKDIFHKTRAKEDWNKLFSFHQIAENEI